MSSSNDCPTCATCDGTGYIECSEDVWRNGTHDTRDWREDCPHPLCCGGEIEIVLARPCPRHGRDHLRVDEDGYDCLGACACPGSVDGEDSCPVFHGDPCECLCGRCGRPESGCQEAMSDERLDAINARLDAREASQHA